MINFQDLPNLHGSYVLQLSVRRSQPIDVGRLELYQLPLGDYFYVGSARGAGGLQARAGRHLRGVGARHWHIDYLRAIAEVRNVLYTVTDAPLECAWSQALAELPRASIPIPHFGSSDCRSGCAAHLIAFPRRIQIASIEPALRAVSPDPVILLPRR